MRRLAALVLLVVAACAPDPPPPLAGVDLPPAAVPDVIEPSSWSVSFAHEFEPGFWGEGEHFYQLTVDCPLIMDEPLYTPPIIFEVERLSLPFDHIYLRLGGLSDTLVGPVNVDVFGTSQITTAIVTILGVPESNALAAVDECAGTVTWDMVGEADLLPREPFRP